MLTSEDYVDVFSENPYIDVIKVTPSVHAHGGHITTAYDSYLARELSTNIDDYDVLYSLNTLTFWGEYRRTGVSLADHYAAMAEVYPLGDRKYEVYLRGDEEKIFTELYPDIPFDGKFITLHGAAGWDLKAFPWFKWIDIFKYVMPTLDCPIVFIGSDDSIVPEHILKELKDYTVHQAINLPIKTQKWIIDKAYMYIGPDSGPMHLAGATSTPIMSYFAGTSQFVAPPRSEKFVTVQSDASCGVPCGIPVCETHELCAKLIEPYHVAQGITRLDEAIKNDEECTEHYRGLNKTVHYFHKWEHISIDIEQPQLGEWVNEATMLDPNWKIER